jgi:glycine hydroxymethyltransferase
MRDTLPPFPHPGRLEAALKGDVSSIPRVIEVLAEEHGAWNAGCLDLVASHNCLGPKARALLSSSLADQILSGAPGQRSHSGGAWIEAIESITTSLCKRIFGALSAEFRPMSGAQANGVTLAALTKPGDTVMAQPAKYGGHKTYREDGYAGLLGLQVVDMPWDTALGTIDLNRLEEHVRTHRPKLLLLGTASLRFSFPLTDVRAIADRVSAKVFYDGAHVLGLVAGGRFQRPLREGAHILTGSTQKTLGGPIGGLVLTTEDETARAISRATSRQISNYHNNRIASLAISLAEMEQFGSEYAAQVVANARALARALAQAGIPIVDLERGHTESHIVVFDTLDLPTGDETFRRLEQARILTSHVELPASYPARRGIRLGTSAVTRLGMKEAEMVKVATLIGRVTRRDSPEQVAADATELAHSYQHVQYCFR